QHQLPWPKPHSPCPRFRVKAPRRVTLVPGHIASVYPALYYADDEHIDPTSETDPVNALLGVAERVTSH
ncbi:hypothetical protein, partial [Streptomyces sp. CNQ431]|uniref:hypothetical protein n=1 Tax=Streptomyces sp. CNQ431 TaxID=1571532 RepID=UPI0012FF551C